MKCNCGEISGAGRIKIDERREHISRIPNLKDELVQFDRLRNLGIHAYIYAKALSFHEYLTRAFILCTSPPGPSIPVPVPQTPSSPSQVDHLLPSPDPTISHH